MIDQINIEFFFLTNIKIPHSYSTRQSTQEIQGVCRARRENKIVYLIWPFSERYWRRWGRRNVQETQCNPLCCAVVHIVCVGSHVVCVGNTRVSSPEPNRIRHRQIPQKRNCKESGHSRRTGHLFWDNHCPKLLVVQVS